MLDTFFMHIIWLSGFISFMIVFLERNAASLTYLSLLLSFFVYVFSLFLFFKIDHGKKNKIINSETTHSFFLKRKKAKLTLILIIILYLLSKYEFFEYAINNPSIADLANYRFIELQGRSSIARIITIGATPFIYFFSFRMIHSNIERRSSSLILFVIIVINIMSGGRSSVLAFLFSLGFYFFYFRHELSDKIISKINKISPILIILSLLLAIFVSSLYGNEETRESGLTTVINRIFANHDGLEYYLKYDNGNYLKTGIEPYFLSIFAVYIKQFTTLDYKNIGWQLSELAIGSELTFSQGANYTFFLQGLILFSYFSPLYAIFIARTVSKLRYTYGFNKNLLPLHYAFSSVSFMIASDIEYFVLNIISILIIYTLLIYPILKVRI